MNDSVYYDILLWKYTTHFSCQSFVSKDNIIAKSITDKATMKLRRNNLAKTSHFLEKLLVFVQWFMWILSTSFGEMNRRQIRKCATSRRVNRKRKKSNDSYLKYPNAQCWFGNDSMYGFEINKLQYERMYRVYATCSHYRWWRNMFSRCIERKVNIEHVHTFKSENMKT